MFSGSIRAQTNCKSKKQSKSCLENGLCASIQSNTRARKSVSAVLILAAGLTGRKRSLLSRPGRRLISYKREDAIMALKNFRPLTPAQRFKQTSAYGEITKDQPEKSLVEPLKRTGGRNNNGRLTSRHIGGGHKRKYRIIDFKRKLRDVQATVEAIEYDPNRSSRIALLRYADGDKTYILAPNGLAVGAKVVAGENVAPEVGNALPLKSIPLGTVIHNVEITPGRGGQVARSAGQQAILSNREGGYPLVRLPP